MTPKLPSEMKVAEEKADSNQTTLETIVAETLIETAVLASLLTNMLTTMFVPALLAKMVVSATELDDPTLGADTIVLENNSCIASIIFAAVTEAAAERGVGCNKNIYDALLVTILKEFRENPPAPQETDENDEGVQDQLSSETATEEH